MAFGYGALAALGAAAASWLLGLLPEEVVGAVALGAGAAVAASGLAVLLHGRLLDRRSIAGLHGDARLIAARLQGLMAAALALKLVVVTAGVLLLRSQGLKFVQVAAFAIAFAAASLICQVTAAGTLVRSLSRRREGAAPAAERPTGGPS